MKQVLDLEEEGLWPELLDSGKIEIYGESDKNSFKNKADLGMGDKACRPPNNP